MRLAVDDTGAIRKLSNETEIADDTSPTDDDGTESNLIPVKNVKGELVGKVKAIRRLLAIGGGIDRSWNGNGFPGFKVLIPSLKKPEDPNSGITTSHFVTFWPSLKPVRNQLSGFPCDVTMSGALRDESDDHALVSPKRFGALSASQLADEYHDLKERLRRREQRDNDDMAACEAMPEENNQGQVDLEAAKNGIMAPSLAGVEEPDEDPLQGCDEAPTTIRRGTDGMAGQGAYERPGQSKKTKFGYSAGMRVTLKPAHEVRTRSSRWPEHRMQCSTSIHTMLKPDGRNL